MIPAHLSFHRFSVTVAAAALVLWVASMGAGAAQERAMPAFFYRCHSTSPAATPAMAHVCQRLAAALSQRLTTGVVAAPVLAAAGDPPVASALTVTLTLAEADGQRLRASLRWDDLRPGATRAFAETPMAGAFLVDRDPATDFPDDILARFLARLIEGADLPAPLSSN